VSRRLPLLAGLATLLLVLTGCGGSSPQDLLDGAPAALEEAGSSRFEMRVTAVGEGVDSRYSAVGEQDFATGTMRMEADLGLEASSTETLAVGEVMYLRSPLFVLFTGDEESWVRVDLRESGQAAGLDVDALVEGQTGPAALLQQLRGAADEVEEVGEDEIRGVSTTHLRVVVDTQRAIEDAPPAAREQLRTFAEASGMPDEYPMEVWIDDDGLPRRLSTIVEVQDETMGTVTQQTVLELYDFGVNVRVEEPDEDEVVDLRELMADMEQLEEELRAEEGGGLGADPDGDLDADADGDPDADADGDAELDELREQLEELEDDEG
jgi:hypothetical protein